MHTRDVAFSLCENVVSFVSSLVLFAMSTKIIKTPRKRAINDLDSVDTAPTKRRRLNKLLRAKQPVLISERQFYHSQRMNAFLINAPEDELDDSASDFESTDQQIYKEKIYNNRNLNDGEQAMMDLWNQHVSKQRIPIGTKHMRALCRSFIDCHLRDILHRNLYRNYLVHLCNLHDYKLLESTEFLDLVQHIQKCMGINTKTNENAAINDLKTRKPIASKKSKSPPQVTQHKQVTYRLRSANSTALG